MQEMVHLDQAYWASIKHVKYHFPANAAHLLRSLVRIMDIWWPRAHPTMQKLLMLTD
ncbi:hypothetical protein V8D89_009378 [Ganoderma adspersum]